MTSPERNETSSARPSVAGGAGRNQSATSNMTTSGSNATTVTTGQNATTSSSSSRANHTSHRGEFCSDFYLDQMLVHLY